MRNDNSALSCIGAIALLVGVIVVTALMSGWALSVLWGWFIVPVFELPQLTLIQAIGVGMVVSFLTRSSWKKEEKKETSEAIIEAVVTAIGLPLISVGFGWVVMWFM